MTKTYILRSLSRCLESDIQSHLLNPSVVGVTIGNFDGLHLGHQALFARLDQELTKFLPSDQQFLKKKILLTFSPHPKQFFSGISRRAAKADPNFHLLSRLHLKYQLLANAGFDFLFIERFNAKFSELSAKEFIQRYLLGALHVKCVVIGHDWAFGRGREGGVELLRRTGEVEGFEVHVVEPVMLNQTRISSGLVKSALSSGDLKAVKDYIGREFSLIGRIISVEGRGRGLGFPTANMKTLNQLLPPKGVYATRALIDGVLYPAVTNLGVRPSFGGGELLIETHILDSKVFNLYKKRMTLEFVSYLRNEIKFDDISQLKTAIEQDVRQARQILKEDK